MKVLLLGEFSAFNYNLKQGLQALGVDVTLAANGDGWKQIPGADMELFRTGDKNPLKKIYYKLIKPCLEKEKFYGYDVVQMMHEDVFRPYINSYMVKNIKKNNGKLFVNVCGNANSLYQAWKNRKLEYYTYDDNEEKYRDYESNSLRCRMMKKTEAYVDSIADGIITMGYEYSVGIEHLPNYKGIVPVPFDASQVEYRENIVGDKLVFFHGILREKDKGTNYIREAFDIIQKKYPNQVETIINGRLPLKEYLEVLNKTNVLVDCCKEHVWGLNACYGMAQGKVVMGCATENSLRAFGIDKTPVIHIGPSVEQIVSQMEYLIQNKDCISRWGRESREFVETFHSHIKVAQAYMDKWRM